MAIKLRDDLWGYELAISACFLILQLVGMVVCLTGLSALPICKYGNLECFFFILTCSESYFNTNVNPYTCTWVSKNRAIEGSSRDSSDSLALPTAAAVLSLLPGLALIVSTIIRNERFLLGLIELGKAFLLFDAILLTISCVNINELTFDCRFYDEWKHGNMDKCEEGFVNYTAGASVIFVTQIVLLMGIIAFGEMERKRVRSNDVEKFGRPASIDDIRTNAVPMQTNFTS